MNVLIGLIAGLVFFICLGLAFYIGYRLGNKPIHINTIDQQKREEIKRRREGLQNIMDYDINKAMGVKHG